MCHEVDRVIGQLTAKMYIQSFNVIINTETWVDKTRVDMVFGLG